MSASEERHNYSAETAELDAGECVSSAGLQAGAGNTAEMDAVSVAVVANDGAENKEAVSGSDNAAASNDVRHRDVSHVVAGVCITFIALLFVGSFAVSALTPEDQQADFWIASQRAHHEGLKTTDDIDVADDIAAADNAEAAQNGAAQTGGSNVSAGNNQGSASHTSSANGSNSNTASDGSDDASNASDNENADNANANENSGSDSNENTDDGAGNGNVDENENVPDENAGVGDAAPSAAA